jgi:twitching motility protein PilI
MHGPEDSTEALFVFSDGPIRYALEAPTVLEVAGHQTPTPVPFAPGWIPGLVNVHGRIVPVLHLGGYFGVESAAPKHCRRLLVVGQGDRLFALQADRIFGVQQVAREAFEPLLDSTPEELRRCSRSQFRLGGEMVLVLEVQALIERTRSKVGNK